MNGRKLVGYTKHVNSEPGAKLEPSDKTTYCAIEIANAWRFVDPNWGSAGKKSARSAAYVLVDDSGNGLNEHIKGTQDYIYEFDEYYFLTNPEQLIYTHIPLDEHWQLLARPVTLAEFTEMAFLKDAFFKLDLELLNQPRCVINTASGEVDIKIKLPIPNKFLFHYKLWIEKSTERERQSLTRCCIMQQIKNKVLECILHFPFTGKYRFELYGGLSANSKYIQETVSLDLLCVYVINNVGKEADVSKLPQNTHQQWGPGICLSIAGLNALSHHHALIEAQLGHVDMLFTSSYPVQIATSLTVINADKQQENEVKSCVTHYESRDNHIAVHVNLPSPGTYTLTIYSKDRKTDGPLPWACSYMIESIDPAPRKSPYPVESIGVVPHELSDYLVLASHESPLIRCSESGETTLVFTGEKNYHMIIILIQYNLIHIFYKYISFAQLNDIYICI